MHARGGDPMKIQAIKVYQVDLPLKEGRYSWSDGKYVEVFDCTIVEIETDAGLAGVGEVCPLGPFYLPAYGPGARVGIAELAPHLIGRDPTETGVINLVMDQALLGHPYVKSAIDIACWDLAGKKTGSPVCDPVRRASWRGGGLIPRHQPGGAGEDGGQDRRLPGRRLHQVSTQGRRQCG